MTHIEEVKEIRRRLRRKLSDSRYEHTLSVAFTCICLAMRYGYPPEKAEIAGLLHDCAKGWTDEEIVRQCEKHHLPITKAEYLAPAVLHAKLGAWLAEHRYGIEDPEILSAIACHTTGKPDMQLLDKILYIADYIEIRRDKASNLPAMRNLAFSDPDECLYQILAGTLDYLQQKGVPVDPMTQTTFDWVSEHRKDK